MSFRKPRDLSRDEPRLVRFERGTNKSMVQQLLASAMQKFEDANREVNSGPTRLEASYDTILFCALALFASQGYRVSAHAGHHKIALEGLAAELTLGRAVYDEIQLLLEVRNSKYSGLLRVKPADLKTAMQLGQRILNDTESWFRSNKPEFLKAN